MVIPDFAFARTPKIVFGPGKLRELGQMAEGFGKTALILTGARSFTASGRWDALGEDFSRRGVAHYRVTVEGEPSPESVDAVVADFKGKDPDVVIGIGGGSVMDAGKAVAAMLRHEGPVVDYLEGVGTKTPTGAKVPFIAVPTTCGTGSEATKNAVLSEVGTGGFKKSLRHDNFVPDVALIDPELALSCPRDVSAACGMDAFTQLLEPYVSTKSNPLTDAVALSGLDLLRDNLLPSCTTGADDVDVRAAMAYAGLMSGIALANAGLGIVHGLAAPLGGFFDIPHGVICGTLTGPAIEVNIAALKRQGNAGEPGLFKYATAGALLTGEDSSDRDGCLAALVAKAREWTRALKIPPLSDYGVKAADVNIIVAGAGNKNNPVALSADEIKALLMSRIH
ncbi:MAG: iron-containing alcohol dehydrogenase [Elusimicrobiota bacterium]